MDLQLLVSFHPFYGLAMALKNDPYAVNAAVDSMKS